MSGLAKIAVLSIALVVAARARPAFEFSLHDAEGAIHQPEEWAQARAVVLFFVTTDCPLSNGYAPEMNRIEQAYAPRSVRFYAVQGDTTIAGGEIVKSFSLELSAVSIAIH